MSIFNDNKDTCQLSVIQSIKGKNPWHNNCFALRNSQEQKQIHFKEIYSGKCLQLFPIFEIFGTPCTVVERFHPVPSCCMQWNIPVDYFFLLSDKLEGTFQRRSLGKCFLILSEHRLNPKVFVHIESYIKLCCINVLGQSIVTMNLMVCCKKNNIVLNKTGIKWNNLIG